MLSRLYIKNFALFETAEVNFGTGLNVLTGETGAGKSLLIGALELIFGKRNENSLIFNPDEKCVIEAEFNALSKKVQQTLLQFEAFDIDDSHLILRREITPNGKTRAFINDTPVSLQILRKTATLLVDLHGQHENQGLLDTENQFAVLDEFAGCKEQTATFAQQLIAAQKIQKEIESLKSQEAEVKRQSEYYSFQADEIAAMQLLPGEDISLEQELKLLENAEVFKKLGAESFDELYDNDSSLYNRISSLQNRLNRAGLSAAIHADFTEKMQEAISAIQETSNLLESELQKISDDPARLQIVQDRLDGLNKLKMKFSLQSVEELNALAEKFAEMAKATFTLGNKIKELENEWKSLKLNLEKSGAEIHELRKKGIAGLEKEVNRLLPEVALNKGMFQVDFTLCESPSGWLNIAGKTIEPHARGIDRVSFLVSANAGIPPAPLSAVASGGEISRIMLVIKTALAGKAGLSTLIFDEIDTGISGETAMKVARVMKKTASKQQIIAITHLPQIAAAGEIHFVVNKTQSKGKTISSLSTVSKAERITTLATMISGESPSAAAIKNAKELVGEFGG